MTKSTRKTRPDVITIASTNRIAGSYQCPDRFQQSGHPDGATTRYHPILVRERDLFGHWASRWRVTRTSNACMFCDPLQRPEGVPASKSENPPGTQNAPCSSSAAPGHSSGRGDHVPVRCIMINPYRQPGAPSRGTARRRHRLATGAPPASCRARRRTCPAASSR